MRINSCNLKAPCQQAYAFADGQLHNDPAALSNYLAGTVDRLKNDGLYTRSYEKAKRLVRIAERARKAGMRQGER